MIRTFGEALKTGRGALVVFVLAVLLLTGGIVLLWTGNTSPAAKITVRGNRYLVAEEVILLSGLEAGAPLDGKAVRKARTALLKHPVVRDVEIARIEGSLVVTVFERVCVALVRKETGGRLYEVDKDLRILSDHEVRCSDVPVISGRFSRSTNCFREQGACFKSARLRGLTSGFLRLKRMYPMLAGRISELRIRHDGALVIYLTGTRLRIVTAGQWTSGDINRIYAALAYVESEGRERGIIDLRERDGLFYP